MFAQSPSGPAPLGPFIILSKVDSTNNYAMAKLHAGLLVNGTSIMALVQTAGKGQRGKQWLASPGENITLSAIYSLQDSFSPSTLTRLHTFPFLYSASIALGCYDFIKASGISDITIKWPNDVYIGDRKAGGILIENVYRNSIWTSSVTGIGINLNQLEFTGISNNATSIASHTGRTYNVIKQGKVLVTCIGHRLAWLNDSTPQLVMHEYNSVLYKAGEEVRIKKENSIFTTCIQHVDVHGRLHTLDVINREFNVGEIEFVTAGTGTPQ